ncbi:MAG: hypothetical protein IMZ52_03030 [Actinobacteria bacterium]|nr:hypothetical protein [Actinomycetota bacterium]MBE3114794.1 hypothetical protein [Actinomycetota bacterium]
MKKISALIIALVILTCISISGCVDTIPKEKTFRSVKIISIVSDKTLNEGEDNYKIIFSNGMEIKDIIDDNIWKLDTNSTFEYITFITGVKYRDAWSIKDYKYVGDLND